MRFLTAFIVILSMAAANPARAAVRAGGGSGDRGGWRDNNPSSSSGDKIDLNLSEEQKLKLLIISRLRKEVPPEDQQEAIAAVQAMPLSQLQAVSQQLSENPEAPVHFSSLNKKSPSKTAKDGGSSSGGGLDAAAKKKLLDAYAEGDLKNDLGDIFDSLSPAQRLLILKEIKNKMAAAKHKRGEALADAKNRIKQKIIQQKIAEAMAAMEAKYPKYPEIKGNDPSKLKPGVTYTRKITAGGRQRFYEVYLPKSWQAEKRYPLVMNLHGGMGNPSQQAKCSGMKSAADRHGFVAVFPAGTSGISTKILLTWNVMYPGGYASDNNVNDMAYFLALMEDAKKLYGADQNRIYSTGISQGGMMSYRLACDSDTSKKIASIGPVAAVMSVPFPMCTPSHPVSVIHFHGLQDTHITYDGNSGGEAVNKNSVGVSVPDTIAFWLTVDGLPKEPARTDTKGQASLKAWGPGQNTAEVNLWTLADGGHTWPGHPESGEACDCGNVNMDIDATELGWEFFSKHPFVKAGAGN